MVATSPPATKVAPGGVGGAGVVERLRAGFDAGVTRPLEWRRRQLVQMRRMLVEGESELLAALAADLSKPAVEGRLTDVTFVTGEIDVALRGLEEWCRPERVPVPLVQRPARASVVREPLGVALVIAPWNYPVNLLLSPMVAAIAAGNAVVGKPSELAPATSSALARLSARYLDQAAVAVVEGGAPETTELLSERFDHIFYTGGSRVARVVMEAAARHLTPVTLELGGKSPALVDQDADLEVAARRIAWGKFVNAGQTCVAPDYVLCHRDVEEDLVGGLARAIRRFYGPEPADSPDYARIVNQRHFDRLVALLPGGAGGGGAAGGSGGGGSGGGGSGTVAVGGRWDRSGLFIGPTVLRGVDAGSPVMAEEIFGPILPVVAVDDMAEATAFVRARPRPLALYVFARSDETVGTVLAGTSSGGVCVNGTVMQLAVPGLPFGGVGESGTGAYHGRHGFETLSHRRAVLTKPTRPDLPLAYPPYTRVKDWLLRKAT